MTSDKSKNNYKGFEIEPESTFQNGTKLVISKSDIKTNPLKIDKEKVLRGKPF